MKAAATLAAKALSLALGGALSTTVVSALASASATPTTPPMTTSYLQVALGTAANWPLTGTYQNPPMGNPTLGGVPFTTGNLRLVTGGSRADYAVAAPKPVSVSLLLNSAYGFASYQGQTVGKVHLTFSDGTIQDKDIVGDKEVREWWLGNGLLTTLSDPAARPVWQGNGAPTTGIGNAPAVMDMLTVSINPTRASLTGVSVLNTASAPFDLQLSGVTVAYLRHTNNDSNGDAHSSSKKAPAAHVDGDTTRPTLNPEGTVQTAASQTVSTEGTGDQHQDGLTADRAGRSRDR